MQLIIKITKKQNEKKNLSVSAKKNIHVCVPPSIYQKKMRKLRKYGITRIYVYVVCNCAYFMQSLPKLLFEKKQWKFSPPSFIPFKKSAKKYSLKIIWNGMKNENKIFLNLSQWCSVGHFSKTLLNFKIKSEQKTQKSPIPIPHRTTFWEHSKSERFTFWLPFHQGFSQSFRAAAPSFAENNRRSNCKQKRVISLKRKKNFSFFVLTRAST